MNTELLRQLLDDVASGKVRSDHALSQLIEIYESRLKHYVNFEFEIIPDLTIFLDVPVDIIPQRKTGYLDRFEKEGLTFLNEVRNTYIELADGEKQRIISIDGTKKIDWIHKSIITTIEEKGFFTS